MTVETQAAALVAPSISYPTSLFHHHIWPVAWVSVGVIATIAWRYALCKIACNIDPLRGLFAPNTDPPMMSCVSVLPFGPAGPGRALGDDWRGEDRRDSTRLF